MTRLKWLWWEFWAWLWWKFWAWLTTPWVPEDVTGNPRSKKRRGDPEWMVAATQLMYAVNAMMGALIVVTLMLLWAVTQ